MLDHHDFTNDLMLVCLYTQSNRKRRRRASTKSLKTGRILSSIITLLSLLLATSMMAAFQHNQHQQQSPMETVAVEMAMDASRRDHLVKAVIAGQFDIVHDLIEQDYALVKHTLNRKTTLLVLAVEKNHLELSRYLIQRGVPVNGSCHMRLSPLHTAARLLNGTNLIKLLVKNKAKMNPSNAHKYGWWTPLHEAVSKRRVDNCRVLAELGSDLTCRDGRGMTALELAGDSSCLAKAIREGAQYRWIRETMHKLHVISCMMNDGGGQEAAAGGGEEGGGRRQQQGKKLKDMKEKGLDMTLKKRSKMGKPMPHVVFMKTPRVSAPGTSTHARAVADDENSQKKKRKRSKGSDGKKDMKLSKKQLSILHLATAMKRIFGGSSDEGEDDDVMRHGLPFEIRRTIVAYV